MNRRILIWFWSGGGGGSQFALRLAQRLSRQFDADAVTLSLRADDPTRAEASGLRVLRAAIRSDRHDPMRTLGGLAHARHVLSTHAHGADVVVAPMNFATAAPLGASLRKPLVYVAHDSEPHPGDYAPRMQRITQAVLMKRADRVVAVSDYVAGRLRKRAGVARKLRVAPLASVFEPTPSPQRTDGPLRCLFAGRMIAYKGLGVLADALDLVGGDVKVSLVGDGPALNDAMLAHLAALSVNARRQWLSDNALAAEIAAADILLAPYTSASQSGMVAQALSYGVPCVATPVGALAEQIGAAGWMARQATAESFAAALSEACADRAQVLEKRRLALAAAERAWNADVWGWLAAESL